MSISFSSTSYSSVRPTYAASTTSKAAGETATSNGGNNSDTLTLSEEGKQASQKSDTTSSGDSYARRFYGYGYQTSGPPQVQKTFQEQNAEMYAHSKIKDIEAWALGFPSDDIPVQSSLLRDYEIRAKGQLEAKKLDSMVSEKLDKSGIKLSKKETLNFSLNEKGEIKVGIEGIANETRRAEIEKVLNGDDELKLQLMITYATRKLSSDSSYESKVFNSTLLFDARMRLEYGISVHDIELEKPNDQNGGNYYQTCKTAEPGFLDHLYEEERNLYENLTGFSFIDSPEYELNFSFRNGTVIAKGVDDMASLNKRLDTGFRPNADITADLTLTIDGKGDYVNSSVTRLQILGEEIKDPAAFEQAHGRLVANATGANKGETYWNPFAGGVLQELAFDAKRLLTFEFGVDVETMDDVKIDIVGHVDKRQELRITGSKLGTGDLLGDGEESSNSGESSESGKDKKLALFSISSNHDAFAVQIQNVPNKADAEATDANADEPKPSELLLNIKMGTIFGNGIRQYSAKPEMTNFMQEVISSGIKMFRNQSPTINLFGKQ